MVLCSSNCGAEEEEAIDGGEREGGQQRRDGRREGGKGTDGQGSFFLSTFLLLFSLSPSPKRSSLPLSFLSLSLCVYRLHSQPIFNSALTLSPPLPSPRARPSVCFFLNSGEREREERGGGRKGEGKRRVARMEEMQTPKKWGEWKLIFFLEERSGEGGRKKSLNLSR